MQRQTVHRDKNHKEIVEALKRAGMRVFDCAALGSGFPDLVVQRPDGRVFLVEVKSDESTSATKLKREVEFMCRLLPEEYRIFDDPQSAADTMGFIETTQALRRDIEAYRAEVERLTLYSNRLKLQIAQNGLNPA